MNVRRLEALRRVGIFKRVAEDVGHVPTSWQAIAVMCASGQDHRALQAEGVSSPNMSATCGEYVLAGFFAFD